MALMFPMFRESLLWVFNSLIADMVIKMKQKLQFRRICAFHSIFIRKGIKITTAK